MKGKGKGCKTGKEGKGMWKGIERDVEGIGKGCGREGIGM